MAIRIEQRDSTIGIEGESQLLRFWQHYLQQRRGRDIPKSFSGKEIAAIISSSRPEDTDQLTTLLPERIIGQLAANGLWGKEVTFPELGDRALLALREVQGSRLVEVPYAVEPTFTSEGSPAIHIPRRGTEGTTVTLPALLQRSVAGFLLAREPIAQLMLSQAIQTADPRPWLENGWLPTGESTNEKGVGVQDIINALDLLYYVNHEGGAASLRDRNSIQLQLDNIDAGDVPIVEDSWKVDGVTEVPTASSGILYRMNLRAEDRRDAELRRDTIRFLSDKMQGINLGRNERLRIVTGFDTWTELLTYEFWFEQDRKKKIENLLLRITGR